MKNNQNNRSRWAIAAALLAWSSGSHAVAIALDGPGAAVPLGSSVDIEITASGLGTGTAPSIGGYDLLIDFDPTALGFAGATFGDPVLGNQLDLFGFGSLNSVTDLGGSINVFELSFDLATDLQAFQADSFTLATLGFDTLSAGTSALTFGPSTVSDATGFALQPSFTGTSVTAQRVAAPVPEPPVYALMAAGLVAVLTRARSSRGSNHHARRIRR